MHNPSQSKTNKKDAVWPCKLCHHIHLLKVKHTIIIFVLCQGVENCPPCAGVVRQLTEQLKRWRLTWPGSWMGWHASPPPPPPPHSSHSSRTDPPSAHNQWGSLGMALGGTVSREKFIILKRQRSFIAILFWIFFWRAKVCWPLLCLCRSFYIFLRCLDLNLK